MPGVGGICHADARCIRSLVIGGIFFFFKERGNGENALLSPQAIMDAVLLPPRSRGSFCCWKHNEGTSDFISEACTKVCSFFLC